MHQVRDIDSWVTYGAKRENCWLSKLGVDLTHINLMSLLVGIEHCFSQIVDRKRQYLLEDIDTVDFMGRMGMVVNLKIHQTIRVRY